MIVVSILIICLTVLFIQKNHYGQLNSEREHKDVVALSALLEARLTEVEEYKDKVETLLSQAGIKAGFKIK